MSQSTANTDAGDKIVGNGINVSYGKGLPVTGKKAERSSYLLGTFKLYNNNNEKYDPKESTNDYYIRKYSNLKELDNVK